MPEQLSKERQRTEAAFAKEQDQSRMSRSDERSLSTAEEITARQKAARLERDAAKASTMKR